MCNFMLSNKFKSVNSSFYCTSDTQMSYSVHLIELDDFEIAKKWYSTNTKMGPKMLDGQIFGIGWPL